MKLYNYQLINNKMGCSLATSALPRYLGERVLNSLFDRLDLCFKQAGLNVLEQLLGR